MTAAPTAGVEERELVRRMQVELLHLITSAGHLAYLVEAPKCYN